MLSQHRDASPVAPAMRTNAAVPTGRLAIVPGLGMDHATSGWTGWTGSKAAPKGFS
jgi:hypothetical protein